MKKKLIQKNRQIVVAIACLVSLTFGSCEKELNEGINSNESFTEVSIDTQDMLQFENDEAMVDYINKVSEKFNELDQIAVTAFNGAMKASDHSEAHDGISPEGLVLLKKYHKQRLEAIYQIREDVGFVSLQSIIDEVNSLLLLNPEKAESLFDTYKSVISKSDLGYYRSYADPMTAYAMNSKGMVQVGKKTYRANDMGVMCKYEGNSYYETLYQESTAKVASQFMDLKEGVCADYYTPFYRTTWHVGITPQGFAFMQLGSFWLWNGQAILYPSFFLLVDNGHMYIQDPNFASNLHTGFFQKHKNNLTILTVWKTDRLYTAPSVIREMNFPFASHMHLGGAVYVNLGTEVGQWP